MANQYMGSFEHVIKQKFQCSAEELLNRFADEELTYVEAEKKIGLSQATIRKWAKRYGVELERGESDDDLSSNVRELFFSPQLNVYNILSRPWLSTV